jgi:beta-glucosidase
LAAVLFGEHNPSSKLPVTFRDRVEDFPSHPFYPGKGGRAFYNEDIFIGYRSSTHQSFGAFGFGLSYTTFNIGEPTQPEVDQSTSDARVNVSLRVPVTNTGERQGAEVVQCYISAPKGNLPRPTIELAAFAKVKLQPGETKSPQLRFDRAAFSYWDTNRDSWYVEAGRYTLRIGNASNALSVSVTIDVREGFSWRGL